MVDNLEMLKRAKTYLEQLAHGFDPISGESLPNDTVLNNVRISRCFFFVTEILQQVIDNGGKVVSTARKSNLPFKITEEQKSKIVISDEPIQISEFTNRINEQVDETTQGKLKVTVFGTWLVEKGFMKIEIRNNKKHKLPTDAGAKLGIVAEWRDYEDRSYYKATYSRQAQQFLLDHLDEIIAFANR